MTKLQRLLNLKSKLSEILIELDYFINLQKERKYNEIQEYEQKKARGQCTAAISCERPLVPNRKMCQYHLDKAVQRSNRRRVNAPATKGVEVKKWRYQQRSSSTI